MAPGRGEREASEERLNGDGSGAVDNGDVAAAVSAAAENGDPSPAKPQGGGLRMWRAARDRAAWKADVLNVRGPAPCFGNPLMRAIRAACQRMRRLLQQGPAACVGSWLPVAAAKVQRTFCGVSTALIQEPGSASSLSC
jgi:hypothetical protein